MPAESTQSAVAPHPTLDAYYSAPASKRGFVNRVFDLAAGDYDRVENLMALGTGRWYRRQALLRAGLAPGMRVLDVAAGTGLLAREEIRITGDSKLVLGLDPSASMLQQAVQGLNIGAVLGLGEQLPLTDQQFDFVSMGYALRHLGDVTPAFAEFHRVLRPGGRVCILEISRPRGALHRMLLRTYMRRIIPALARLGSRGADSRMLWQYYWDTIEACVGPQTVLQCLTSCGFVEVNHRLVMGMFSEYTAQRPMGE